jgi:hypothetical protein
MKYPATKALTRSGLKIGAGLDLRKFTIRDANQDLDFCADS